jgi:hypothetical protein
MRWPENSAMPFMFCRLGWVDVDLRVALPHRLLQRACACGWEKEEAAGQRSVRRAGCMRRLSLPPIACLGARPVGLRNLKSPMEALCENRFLHPRDCGFGTPAHGLRTSASLSLLDTRGP